MTEPKNELNQALASAGEAVIGIGVLTGLGAWGGMWLDTKLHTTPLLAITLSLLGVGGGLARMVIKALQSEKNDGQSGKQ